MPDISITGVSQIAKTTPVSLLLGATCAAFDIVQKVGSSYVLADGTDTTLTNPSHILLQGGVDTEYVVALPLLGSYTLAGPTLVKGTQYVCSAGAPGKLAPKSDLTTGQFLGEVFVASTTAIADMSVTSTGIAMP